MVLNKYTGSNLMDGNEDSLFKIVGAAMKTFASYIYLKALQAGDTIRLRVYEKVDDVSRYKLDGDVNDSVGSNNGTVTNIASWLDQWKFDGDVNDSIGSNNGTITYHSNLNVLYKFENAITDSTSNANNLTKSAGTQTFVRGQEGFAISLDGSTYYTSGSNMPSGTGDRSVSFWIKTPASFVSNTWLFSWGVNSAQTLFGASWNSTGSSSTLIFQGGSPNTLTTTTVFQPNTWYYLTLVISGGAGKVATWYINGVQDSTVTFGTALNTTADTLKLGAYLSGIDEMTGLLDEYRVYNIALSLAQVSALYMNGKFGQSHTFDGGEYITAGTTSTWKFMHGGSACAVSLWAKIPVGSLSGTPVLIGTYDTGLTHIGFSVFIRSTGEIDFTIGNGGGVAEYLNVVSATGKYPNDGNYHHIVATFDGTTGKIYIDSIDTSASSTVTGSASSSNSTDALVIGEIASLTGNQVTGQLDEVRLYSSNLTASQVLGLYNYTGNNFISPLPQGNAILFNGSTYITVYNQTPYNFERTNSFSISYWLKTTQSGVNVGHVAKMSSEASIGYNIRFDTSNNLVFELGNTFNTNLLQVYVPSFTAIQDGNWHNIIFTYNGSSSPSGVSCYVDNVSKSLTTGVNNLSATIQNTQNLVIGAWSGGSGAISGLLDEVQIYPYVLSSAEIFNINAGRFGNTHPIGLWHFDGDLYDYSGQGSTGIPTGTIEYVTGALSGSYTVPNEHFNFDGSEYILISSPTGIPVKNSDRSVAFWINPINFVGGNVIYFWGSSATDDAFFLQFSGTSGNILASGFGDDLTSTSTLTLNQWNQVVVTFSGNTLTIYINGIAAGTKTTGNINTTTGTNVYIASSNSGLNNYVGHLDDFRIYTRALSSAEVSDLYTYPDSAMKQLVYDRSYSGPKSDAVYVPTLQGNQYMVTSQQTSGTNRIISWEREEYT